MLTQRLQLFITAFATLVLLWSPLSFSADLDRIIKRSAEMYLPGVDWLLWKAQIKQESSFNCNATSPVGAQGCAQIMPATMRDISRLSGILGSAYDPEIGIAAGAFYMAQQRAIFRAPRPDFERHNLAMAAYNAGAGSIIKAQKLAGNPPEWQPVADKLHLVTGRHSHETIGYVKRIRQFHKAYLLGAD